MRSVLTLAHEQSNVVTPPQSAMGANQCPKRGPNFRRLNGLTILCKTAKRNDGRSIVRIAHDKNNAVTSPQSAVGPTNVRNADPTPPVKHIKNINLKLQFNNALETRGR